MSGKLSHVGAMGIHPLSTHVGAKEIAERIKQVGSRVRQLELGPGHRVLIPPQGPDLWAPVATYLGVLASEQTPALLRPRDLPHVDAVAHANGFAATAIESEVRPVEQDHAARHQEALIVFTSGTAGAPKGVRYSGAGTLSNLDATQSFLAIDRADNVSIPLPVHYVFGLATLTLAVREGASVHLPDYRLPPIQWLADLSAAGTTLLVLIPQQVRLLLRSSAFCANRLPRLRRIAVAGGGLDDRAAMTLVRRFPGTQILLMYGQAEAGPRISYLPHEDLVERGVSVGRGIPGFTRIRVNCQPGTEGGEVEVRTDSVMLGYLDGTPPPLTDDGWLATGDLGEVDGDGYVRLVARAAPYYKAFGERVGFEEVVRATAAFRSDLDVRFEIITDLVTGESVRLHITSNPALTSQDVTELTRHLQRELSPGRCPKEIFVHRTDPMAKLQ